MTFAEMAMVEVSTDGTTFARFPMRYDGPQGPLPIFSVLPWGSYSGLTGAVPALADVVANTLDPRDPSVSGGEAFDLADLANVAEVISGQVDLTDVNYIRLVDLVAGTVVDSRLVTIWDSGGGPEDSADIDSITVIHHTGNQVPDGPTVDLSRDALGYVWLELSDPNGFADLDLAGLSMSVNLAPVPFFRLRDYFVLESATANGIVLRSPLPMYLENFQAVLALSVTDSTGNTSTDQISLNR